MRRVLEQLRSVDTPDGTVVLDVETGKMFRLNPVGAQILSLLKQGTPIGQVEEVISREYHVEIEAVREDVRHFLTALAACGLADRNAADSGL
jgi:Coenzyme PQQ synthesis protein D (PqqD)